jgi:hypothetical protein
MFGRRTARAANELERRDVDFGADVVGELQPRALTEEIGARLASGGGGYHSFGDSSHATNSFGGTIPYGPQGFVGAANVQSTGHIFADPADNRIESPGGSNRPGDVVDRLFLERMIRRS